MLDEQAQIELTPDARLLLPMHLEDHGGEEMINLVEAGTSNAEEAGTPSNEEVPVHDDEELLDRISRMQHRARKEAPVGLDGTPLDDDMNRYQMPWDISQASQTILRHVPIVFTHVYMLNARNFLLFLTTGCWKIYISS